MTDTPKIDEDLLNWRLGWVKREADKAERESNFQNGLRAGLDRAYLALTEGRTNVESIDPPARGKKGRR